MKCISFDRDIIDINLQKMARIYFELGGDSSLKQAFRSSLPKMLVGHAMAIIKDRFKSITIPHIGYIMQAIFQPLDCIYQKRSILKQVIQNNPALDKVCTRSYLVTKSDCSCPSRRARQKTVKQYWRFKVTRVPNNRYRMTRHIKFFRRKSLGNYRKNDQCFIYNKYGHFAKNFPHSTRSIKNYGLEFMS
ncbi:hypothetical protein RDI58_000932 [Solanum bulbocastanum]|uniref:Uncharacterized protein n=1 Tax=Solanum bulbocastanum TaxID=147425 RepID=A0AAN8U8G5_SOLBU